MLLPIIHITLITSLMFLDYYLTLKGFRLYKEGYSKHVEAESYELNPIFMKSISSNKYNLIHLISVVFIAVLLAVVYFLSTSQKLYFNIGTYDLLIGMLVSMFAFINSKHLFNLMIFKEIKKNPSILSGKIMQSYEYSIKTSIAQALTTSFVLFFVFVFSPSYFTFGFFLGPLVIALKMKKWGKKRDNNKEIKIKS